MIVALDGYEEWHLPDIDRAVERWRSGSATGPVLVAMQSPGVAPEQPRLAQLSRVAARWHACVVEPPTLGERGLADAVNALCESLCCPGLVGFDFQDFATMTAAPAVGRCLSTRYVPGADTWIAPQDWRDEVRGVRRLLLTTRVVAGTTLFDINSICASISELMADDASLLVGAPVIEGDPRVAVIVLEPVAR
jgi:hypothetical protein